MQESVSSDSAKSFGEYVLYYQPQEVLACNSSGLIPFGFGIQQNARGQPSN